MNKKAFIILAGLFTLLYLGTLSLRPLFTPDEPRYAEIAREMIVNNEWIVPKFNNLCYFEKPIMGHWLNALSLKTFGENNFAVRFSSALTALLTALMLGWFVKRFTDRRTAYMTTSIYLTMGLVFGVGTFAVLDTPLNFFLTGTLICFYCAYQKEKWDWKKFIFLIMAGVFCGGAFLTKGFLAFAFPGMIILLFLFWQKDFKSIFTLPWVPLIFVLAVIAPWAIAIHQRDGDFWHYFFWVEHIQRALKEDNSQHPKPFFYLIPWMLIGPLPWTFFIWQIIKGYGKRWKEFFQRPMVRYALLWALVPFVFCSIPKGKLITYILPCFPGIAFLFAFGLNEYFKGRETKDFDLVLKIFYRTIFIAISLLAIVQILYSIGILKLALYNSEETYKWALAAAALLIWAFCARSAVNHLDSYLKFGFFTIGAVVVIFVYPLVVPDHVLDKKAPCAQLAKFKKQVDKDTILVSYKNLIGAVCWTYKRDDVYLYHKAGELSYGIKRPDAKHRLVSYEDFLKLIKNPAKDVVIIMDSKRRRKKLPDYETGSWEKNVFFKEYNKK